MLMRMKMDSYHVSYLGGATGEGEHDGLATSLGEFAGAGASLAGPEGAGCSQADEGRCHESLGEHDCGKDCKVPF